jgi:hypothetical protein
MSVMIANNHSMSATQICFQNIISEHNELLQRYNSLKLRHEKLLKKCK